MSKTYKTKKGSELPLMNLKGKDYLQVAHRLLWFEEENKNYDISTKFLVMNEDQTVAQATIIVFDDSSEAGKIIRKVQATKSETVKDFKDHMEKAETGAIGRALAMLGYGTQFTGDELEEGARLADSPTTPAAKAPSSFKRKTLTNGAEKASNTAGNLL